MLRAVRGKGRTGESRGKLWESGLTGRKKEPVANKNDLYYNETGRKITFFGLRRGFFTGGQFLAVPGREPRLFHCGGRPVFRAGRRVAAVWGNCLKSTAWGGFF